MLKDMHNGEVTAWLLDDLIQSGKEKDPQQLAMLETVRDLLKEKYSYAALAIAGAAIMAVSPEATQGMLVSTLGFQHTLKERVALEEMPVEGKAA